MRGAQQSGSAASQQCNSATVQQWGSATTRQGGGVSGQGETLKQGCSMFTVRRCMSGFAHGALQYCSMAALLIALAEGVRFELTDGCPSAVFKTAALNHSATLPERVKVKPAA